MFLEEMEVYAASAPALARENVERFFIVAGIDRANFEQMINRLSQRSGPIYYVSTVARGLAGSKSDIDIIIPSSAGAQPLSSMLFHGERRIGAKVIEAQTIDAALRFVSKTVSCPEDHLIEAVGFAERDLPVKWCDLERIVNGYSFEAGTPYATALRDICRWALGAALGAYRANRELMHLAISAGRVGAAHAYCTGHLIAAMDAVMASCGRVQSNTKWTLQRWSQFRLEIEDETVRDGADVLQALLTSLRDAPFRQEGPLLAETDEFITATFQAMSPHRSGGLSLGEGTITGQFLPEASFISDGRRTVVIPSDHLACIEVADVEPSQADAWLTLIQFDLGRLGPPVQ
jgi:hypothetical protein